MHQLIVLYDKFLIYHDSVLISETILALCRYQLTLINFYKLTPSDFYHLISSDSKVLRFTK